VSAPWELVTPPDASATSIDINVVGGGCGAKEETLGDVDVEETEERVVVTAHIREPFKANSGVCTDIGRLHPASVQLRSRLGDRVLIDGHTGEPAS
jgi:hypothetical protein